MKMEDRTLLQNIRAPKASTPVLVISKLIVIVLPATQIAIGALYLHDCPRQPYIPVYLMVMGVFGMALALLSCLPCTREPEDGSQSPLSSFFTAWNSLVSLFLFCWFITGNVWIYSIHPPNFDVHSAEFCNKTLYLFAFWTTTLVYIFLGVLIAGGCCVFFWMFLCGRGALGAGYSEDV